MQAECFKKENAKCRPPTFPLATDQIPDRPRQHGGIGFRFVLPVRRADKVSQFRVIDLARQELGQAAID